MAGCAVDQATIVRTIAFHGHRCPGLSIGIRASEIALREVGSSLDEEVVAVTETDMCAVDAVQFLTGCTFGKGNLLFLDHGKIAFSFFRRSDGKSLRILAKHAPRPDDRARLELRMRRASGHATPEEEKAFDAAQLERCDRIMNADLGDLFEIGPVPFALPERARLFPTLRCDGCGEPFMEPRGRLFKGKTLCIACFEKLERGIEYR